MSEIPHEIIRYANDVAGRLEAALGPKLVGVYLHGSAVLGDFTRSRSDIDIVAVSAEPLSDDEKSTVREELGPRSLPCPALGLEFSLVEIESLRKTNAAPSFEVHIATDTKRAIEKFVDGRDANGDSDLVVHYAVLKTHGLTVFGLPAVNMFPEVPRDMLLHALRGELDWASLHASPSYQVLNAARAWRFVEENVICSKTEGGEWARERVSDSSALDAALAHRRAETDEHPDEAQARAFVNGVEARLDR